MADPKARPRTGGFFARRKRFGNVRPAPAGASVSFAPFEPTGREEIDPLAVIFSGNEAPGDLAINAQLRTPRARLCRRPRRRDRTARRGARSRSGCRLRFAPPTSVFGVVVVHPRARLRRWRRPGSRDQPELPDEVQAFGALEALVRDESIQRHRRLPAGVGRRAPSPTPCHPRTDAALVSREWRSEGACALPPVGSRVDRGRRLHSRGHGAARAR